MPRKILMSFNSNLSPSVLPSQNVNAPSNLGVIPKASSSLKSPIIARIHNVKPGCGSCGR